MTYVLMNRHYYIAFPKTNQAARTVMVLLAKRAYKKELKFAKMTKIDKKLETGILTKRTI